MNKDKSITESVIKSKYQEALQSKIFWFLSLFMHLLKEAMLYETLKKKKKAKNCFEINQDI